MHYATGHGAGVFAIFDHLHAVDKNLLHAGGELLRFFVGRMVLHAGGIEHYDVGEVSFLEQAAIFQMQIFGGQPKTQADTNGQVVMKSDPNRPPDATGQPGQPAEPSADNGDKKKNPLQKIFGIFGGKKKEPDKAKPKPEKGDSP